MNTREQIEEAMRDYQEGKNGFEDALTWKSAAARDRQDKLG